MHAAISITFTYEREMSANSFSFQTTQTKQYASNDH